MSSDGSTWDQTSGIPQPSGVDWNQYDEDLSGQPSLIFVGAPSDSVADSGERLVAEPAQALGALNGLREAVMDPDHQMWASDENSVAFPPSNVTPATTISDGTFVDEGIAGDEADFASNGAPLVESSQPDIVSTTNAAPQPGDPDFHWNLHAPEFEFRPKDSSPSADDEVVSGERKLSATELLVRSSNDAELAVLLAAANDDPDEMESQDDQGLELDPVSPREARPLYGTENLAC